MPELTLADNLAATLAAMKIGREKAIEQEKQREQAALEKKMQSRRYELTKAMLIEQEEQVGKEYKSWQTKYPNSPAEAFFPTEYHPSVYERYQLAEILKVGFDLFKDKRLLDLRQDAGKSPAILASVEAQLAAEDLPVSPECGQPAVVGPVPVQAKGITR
jgi:hypothetical protein